MTILLEQRSQQERKRLKQFVCFSCAEPIRHLVSGMVNAFGFKQRKYSFCKLLPVLEGSNFFVDGKG